MKKFILSAIIALATATSSFAQFSDPNFTFTADSKMSGSTISFPSTSVSIPSTTTVSGYFKDNGTYVDSYVRTRPNSTNWDNLPGRTAPTGTISPRAATRTCTQDRPATVPGTTPVGHTTTVQVKLSTPARAAASTTTTATAERPTFQRGENGNPATTGEGGRFLRPHIPSKQ